MSTLAARWKLLGRAPYRSGVQGKRSARGSPSERFLDCVSSISNYSFTGVTCESRHTPSHGPTILRRSIGGDCNKCWDFGDHYSDSCENQPISCPLDFKSKRDIHRKKIPVASKTLKTIEPRSRSEVGNGGGGLTIPHPQHSTHKH